MMRRYLVSLAPLSLIALGACSGPDDSAPVAGTQVAGTPAVASSPALERDTPATRNTASPASRGDCDLLSGAEIQQAFADALTVTRLSGHGGRDSGCTVSIAQGEESQLVVQAGGRDAFEARKQAYESQSRVTMEPVAIGVEAYLVNGAQVIAVDAQGRSINIGLMLLVFRGEPPIDAAGIAAGLQALARMALERL